MRSRMATARTGHTLSPSFLMLLILSLAITVAGVTAAAAASPPMLIDINPAGSSGPTWLENAGGVLFFQASDGVAGAEPWRSDGSIAGTSLIRDIRVGSQGSFPNAFTSLGSDVLFSANDGSVGVELWRSDGTSANTAIVEDINPGAGDSWPGVGTPFTIAGGIAYFRAYTNVAGYELWGSDGTAAGTTLVKDINPGAQSSTPLDLTDVSGTLLFRADDGLPVRNHRELWGSDGSAAGTAIVKDINPTGEGYPSNPVAIGGILYFSGDDGANGRELWRSDGTEAGTEMVANINPSGNSSPGQLRDLNGTLYFVANDGVNGAELWRSDGTEAGTSMVADLNPSGSFPITQLTVVGDVLFFVVPAGGLSAQLWRSDGTAAGTGLVASFTGNEFPIISELTDVDGVLYFSANDGVRGIELWRSEGTPEGTVLAADINAGDEWSYSSPDELTNIEGTLFFAANDGINGRELWVITNAASTGIPGGAGSAATPALALQPNFPNPFSRLTNLRFELSAAALVRVRLFDAAGREIRDLVPGARLAAGPHAIGWDGRDQSGRLVGSGVYLYRVETEGASGAGRIVLAR